MSMFTTRGSHSVTPWWRWETSASAEDVRRTDRPRGAREDGKRETRRDARVVVDDRTGARTMDRRTLITTAASRGIFPSAALTSAFVDAAAAAAAAMTVLLTGMTSGATRAARADCDRQDGSAALLWFTVLFGFLQVTCFVFAIARLRVPLSLSSHFFSP
jgi:hypothetical protein